MACPMQPLILQAIDLKGFSAQFTLDGLTLLYTARRPAASVAGLIPALAEIGQQAVAQRDEGRIAALARMR